MADVIFENTLPIPASKSMMNRLLICQSYFPHLKVEGESDCDDVVFLKKALTDLNQKKFDVGDGGTTFRFLALRLSRFPGKHILHLSDSLAKRPHEALYDILDQLHIEYQINDHELIIQGGDWHLSDGIEVDTEISSQYLSALLLNAWLLDEGLRVFFSKDMVSLPYYQMTTQILEYLGMSIKHTDSGILIPAQQKINKEVITSELDMSCAFTIASLGTVHHGVEIDPFYYPSIQADAQFLAIFEEMGIPFMYSDHSLKVFPVKEIRAIECDLKESPDLFPVLAILCSLANGQSKLYGAKHLRWKESNRIQSTSELLKILSCKHEVLEDGMLIQGQPDFLQNKIQEFDPKNDHRMAFAAAVAKLAGHNIQILHAECVNKSFKGFWSQFTPGFPTTEK